MDQLKNIKNKIVAIKPELVEKFSVKRIGLFGSIVRDDFNDKSDIDIVVDFNKQVGVEFIDLANFLERKLDKRVDLVSLKGIKPAYLQQIIKEVIYV